MAWNSIGMDNTYSIVLHNVGGRMRDNVNNMSAKGAADCLRNLATRLDNGEEIVLRLAFKDKANVFYEMANGTLEEVTP